ncbi:helix-turn-helix domain-containing protein [Caproicibacterium amylolyticum]|uniref:helix-turn-helix domain-containing protein n=1 Tax=Caproicibacterium amylolyticum TaxID=2766537 RepID=UPI001FE6397C|nr:helix-turn-helix transcriptional regulator [Caproicibacterium amylolyticum]
MNTVQKTYAVFAELLNKNSVTPYRVYKETGVPQSSLSEWKRGNSMPKIDKIQKIADYFGVSVDYLLGNEQKGRASSLDEKKPEDITLDDFTYAFLDESKELTDENKQKLLEMARFFKMQQDKEKKTEE